MTTSFADTWMGFCAGLSIAVLVWAVAGVVNARSPGGQCADSYGTATREYAICVYELRQHIREKP